VTKRNKEEEQINLNYGKLQPPKNLPYYKERREKGRQRREVEDYGKFLPPTNLL